jgi:hypothetical protein
MEERIDEDALNSDSDDSDWKDESGEVVGDATAKRKSDSQLETLLWFNTAGPKNTSLPKRSRETWLQLMKDDRYRLQKVLNAWDSASDMEKCLRKAAVGEVRRASTMQAKVSRYVIRVFSEPARMQVFLSILKEELAEIRRNS